MLLFEGMDASSPNKPVIHSNSTGGDDEGEYNSVSEGDDEDSDDEGTVYADSKEELDVISQPSRTGTLTAADSSLLTSKQCPITIETECATNSDSDEKDNESIETQNIEHCNDKPTSKAKLNMNDLEATAASQVEAAMNAAMEIFRREKTTDIDSGTTTEQLIEANDEDNMTTALDCDTIEVGFSSDTDTQQVSSNEKHKANNVNNDIDDSDEADALSAGSLD